MDQDIPTNHSRALEARALRLGQSKTELTRYSGWQAAAEQELHEARLRHGDPLLGGEELLTLIEADAKAAAGARASAGRAI